jgi:hypothetical protein
MEKLVEEVLNYYIKKEEGSDKKYKYYALLECDSNTTDFECLSNNNRIFLHTNLEKQDIVILLEIFRCVYDKNCWIFDINELIIRCDEDEVKEDEFELMKYYDTKDVLLWIKYFQYLSIYDYNVFDTIPESLSKYNHINKINHIAQKVYKIKDIIKLIW